MNLDEILKERGSRYGDFETHALVTQNIKSALLSGLGHYKLQPYMLESLEMIAHKMGRIVNGDPFYADSWVDIVGYAQLVVNQIKKDEKERDDLERMLGPITKEPSDGYPVYGQQYWNDLLLKQSAEQGATVLNSASQD